MSVYEFDLPSAAMPAIPLPPVAKLHAAAEPRLSNPEEASRFLDEAFADETSQPLPRKSCGPMHRVQEVRREQGISIRRAAQLLRCTVEQARQLEDPTNDLTLAQIYEWQRVLEVPVSDLLVEPYAPLSAPVLERARMVRLMKTVQAIVERSNQPAIRRLGETMAHQLVEVMPELKDVSPWHSIERRKTCNQNARILESDYLRSDDDEE